MAEIVEGDYAGLTAKELKKAQEIIDKAPQGRYTLKKLYGADWKAISSPTTLGDRFVVSVADGKLNSIAFHTHKTGANARLYNVKGGPVFIE